MKKLLITIVIGTSALFANYSASISKISPQIENRMRTGGSFKDYCPITIKDLRYLKVSYIGFDGKEHIGELVVNRAIANSVVAIFKELYNIKYPIRKMHLVSDYGASDFDSIEADNTSAFNCRYVDGTHKWSNHTYGRAIDLNPIENPYVTRSGHTSHSASKKFVARIKAKGVILANDKVVRIFKKYGFRWGGDWNCCKDYQHFDKKH